MKFGSEVCVPFRPVKTRPASPPRSDVTLGAVAEKGDLVVSLATAWSFVEIAKQLRKQTLGG